MSKTLPLSMEMTLTHPFKDKCPLRCQVPSTTAMNNFIKIILFVNLTAAASFLILHATLLETCSNFFSRHLKAILEGKFTLIAEHSFLAAECPIPVVLKPKTKERLILCILLTFMDVQKELKNLQFLHFSIILDAKPNTDS
ncbi:hypothetical protein TNIN_128131 [Trichonephila inaurata madagascariensis]|uniref:Uncharacterized protein n=1 Tax=Trichonephila inaurata madagascariensis TaxID=2747483 RepID=A0A8X6WMX0_9ARAC|nr:hypothetical protein TNIN_252161 [Trichonephila inaurata madagascariensis]GFY62582.1 hypothetical protein TNIN_128131 [Trichonephila inaurata madagascariensis]